MLHLRLLCPDPVTPSVLAVLTGHPGVAHVAVHRGAAVQPPGDVVTADVAREAASQVVAALSAVPGGTDVAVTLDAVDASLSRYARDAEAAAPGLGVDAVVWEEVEARTGEESAFSASFALLLVVATLIAAVGIMLDSEILVVGAMVVGPEFGPLAALTVAVRQRRWHFALRSLRALLLGFPLAILAAYVMTTVVEATVGLPRPYAVGDRPLTAFVSQPDGWALVVALLAGVAGVVSLTSAKSAALVGVAVSVTTVPAAADVGVAAAAQRWAECAGAAGQLTVNLVAVVVAGVLTLAVRRRTVRRTRVRAR